MNNAVEIKIPADVTIGAVPPQNLGEMWHRVEPHLQRVVDHSHGDLTLLSTRNRILKGDCQLLLATRDIEILAAFTVEVRTMDSGKRVLMVPCVGGDEMESWIEQLNDTVVKLATEWCCDEVRGVGRLGWTRGLKKFGWESAMNIVTLEIN